MLTTLHFIYISILDLSCEQRASIKNVPNQALHCLRSSSAHEFPTYILLESNI